MILCLKNSWEWLWSNLMAEIHRALDYFGEQFSKESIAYVLALLTTFSSITVLVIQKLHKLDYSLVLLFRGIFVAISFYSASRVSRNTIDVQLSHDFRKLVLRTLLASTNMGFIYFLATKIPMSLIYIITNTSPMFVFILNYLNFGEKITSNTYYGFLSAFSGIVIIIISQNSVSGLLSENLQDNIYYLLIGIHFSSTILWAYSIILIRKMQKMDNFQNSFFISFGFILVGSFSLISRDSSEIFDQIDLSYMCWLGFVSILGVLSQSFFFGAQFLAPQKNGHIILIGYMSVIWSFLFEYFVFDLSISIIVVIGALLVLLGIYFIIKDKL